LQALRKADGRIYVIKRVSMGDMSEKAQAEAVNEVLLLAKMRSRHVVQYCDSFVEQRSLHIVMEYCNRGDLKALLKKAKEKGSPALPERIIWGVFLQVALGLYDLHRARVLHRDLKTANIFLTRNEETATLDVKIGSWQRLLSQAAPWLTCFE
jgi:NIMA (never in mitosis gene a)-related kinase